MTQKVRLPMFTLQTGAKIAQFDVIVKVSTKGKFMPAFDVCHPQVVRALENDGWIIIMTRTEAAAQAYDTSRLQVKNKHNDENQVMMESENIVDKLQNHER